MYIVTAGNAQSLLEILYVLLIDYLQTGNSKPTEDTALEINSLAKASVEKWATALPGLRNCLIAVLKGKNKQEALISLASEVKLILPEAKKDGSVPAEELELLNSWAMYFRTGSENALAKLKRLASAAKSPWVVQHLAPKATNQADSRTALETLVKALTGRSNSSALTLEEAKQIKELKTEEYRKYLDLRKDFNQSWKDALVAFIRSSGEHMVPYQDALNYLKLNGIDHLMPSGFTGLIDDRGRMYTAKGKAIDGVPNAVTFPSVVMNPNYGKGEGNEWVFMARRTDGEPGPYFYTSDFKKLRAKEKFIKVSSLAPKIEGMRKKWFALVKKFDEANPKCVSAVVLEILYEFSARIGSVGNSAGGTSTFGVATLLVKHAIIDPTGNITLRYKGKDGVAATHKLLKSNPNHRYVIADLKILVEGKDAKERLFTVKKGVKNVPLPPSLVNAYWKSLGAGDTTVHKIRTVAGTKLFQELVDPFLEKWTGQDIPEKKAIEFFKKAAEAVGKKLNHIRTGLAGTKVTGTTAIAAYIDPTCQIQYFRQLGLRPPKFLEKFDQ